MKKYDFFNEQMVFYTGEKHEHLYNFFSQNYKVLYHEFFVMAATIGFIHQRKGVREGIGKEFRSNFFDDKEKSVLYTILLSDEVYGKDIEGFAQKEQWSNYRKVLEEYAVGGMDYIVENALSGKVSESFIDDNYQYYAKDIVDFLLDELEQDPFDFI